MHPTISKMQEIVAKGDEQAMKEILSPNVQFKPPTYYKTWTGRDPVAAILAVSYTHLTLPTIYSV